MLSDRRSPSGFGLAELLMSTAILLILGASVFGLIAEVQRRTGYQSEVQSVLNNTRSALQTIGRHIRQAGNDPAGSGIDAITVVSSSEIRVRSDLTGSAAPGYPDKGDPDGDIEDSGEDVTIRHNKTSRSLEVVPAGGSAQIVAANISGLLFEFYDGSGAPATGKDVKRVHVTISGTSPIPDPQTSQHFGVELSSDFQVAY